MGNDTGQMINFFFPNKQTTEGKGERKGTYQQISYIAYLNIDSNKENLILMSNLVL